MGISGQRHAPAALYPQAKDPGTHWTGGWVGHLSKENFKIQNLETGLQAECLVFHNFN
jgi:hypothetical protein